MLILGPLGFAAPLILTALVALPALWLILRALPPSPRRQEFPGAALLAGLTDRHPVARRTPWWLLLLRLLAVAALIVAFAGPVWQPQPRDAQTGPLLVVLDAGWPAAPDWPQRQARAERALTEAAAAGRPVALLIADGAAAGQGPLAFQTGSDLLPALRAARPAAWTTALPDDADAALSATPPGQLATLWISDGLDHPNRAAWLAALTARGPVTVVPPAAPVLSLTLEGGQTPALILHSLTAGQVPQVEAIGPDPQGTLRALARLNPGDPVAQGQQGQGQGQRRAVAIDLPPELRNRITRYQIEGVAHAGAVVLADDRLRRHKVALVGDAAGAAEGQELLSPMHYLRRALIPVADVIEGGLADVLDAAPDVIVLADQVGLPETGRLAEWVQAGGLLIRFAGPRMAASDRLDAEPLLPVALRPGGRDVGGALSWGDPRAVAPFAAQGLFAGLTPPAEVTVRAQLIAQPSPDLSSRTIAALVDGTPLITRMAEGQGQVVLFHVTANAEWSNLPLSGLFVQMLDRLIGSARAAPGDAPAAETADYLVPQVLLDGWGRASPAADPVPVAAQDFARGPGPGQPAGIYAAGERRAALNAGTALTPALWDGAAIEDAAAQSGRALAAPLIALAVLLMVLDALATAALSRRRRSAATTTAAAAALLMLLAAWPAPRAMAQEVPPETARAADEVALAYVLTGDEAVDETSYQGLTGLSRVLSLRTSVEPGAPVGIDLDSDDLSVLTFLYWPVTAGQPAPSPMAYLRLNHFLRSGGMILFDTRDGDVTGVGGPDGRADLASLAAPLDVPPLAPIPEDHVLTRSFYLLQGFPGRWQGAPVWAEAPPAGAEADEGMPFRNLNDGVSPVIIGGNSWAEAWALDDEGMPVFPVGRGYEGERQREMAFRFGVNLVMYVLTGNYKSDQVHVPALLDRLRIEEMQR
ncbi:MAG: DUF4159 domain-containing protein [Paracoccus sp. (in: a-proteobacteria)]|uniref:DUF4159 domain-containing protein n=1 Tax=Paracoccus sp. TaxID=267 RepID=UPI0026E08DC3|nr:DUF4159 domain-containing protein [Paracoccus sp. (in: a-proteobacteria)]MDO5612130.1 DUF4159 domain-containing protein [Paracoccus sp. (in: a-proteobacteria)]